MSSPTKNQPQTPTLNSLLRQPSAITSANSGPNASQQSGAIGGNGPGSTYIGSAYSPGLVSAVDNAVQQAPAAPSPQLQQGQSDTLYNNRILPSKGTAPGNNYVPDGVHGGRHAYPSTASPFQHHHQQSPHTFYGGPDKGYPPTSNYPQPVMANGPSPNSPRPPAPVAGQLHGQGKQNASASTSGIHDPIINGIPPPAKGATVITGSNSSQGDPTTTGGPKHPSVAALRQEANAISPAGTRNASPSPGSVGAPSSPASLLRHSPVSPTPVTVYNQPNTYHAAPTSVNQFGPVLTQPPPQGGIYDGNNSYMNYNQAMHHGPPVAYAGYTGSQPLTNGPSSGPNNVQSYSGQQPFGMSSSMGPNSHIAQSVYAGQVANSELISASNPYYNQAMKNVEQSRGGELRVTNGPVNSYSTGVMLDQRIMASPATSDSVDATKDSGRNGRGTPNVESRLKATMPATPTGGKIRINGAKESHPSTPVPTSPGGASMEDVDSSLSSPSWPRTPLSPAVRSQSSMGPPAPMGPSSGSSLQSGPGGKDSGANLVARLLGDPVQLGCSPQEWNERKGFYERLVQYCESNGHPITAQPTVSKQTVDLFRLYIAVRQRGGFTEVTKKKLWKELCTLFGISQSNSASGQLKKQYSRLIFPFECFYDMQGADPQPILAAFESKKKTKAKEKAAAAMALANAGQGSQQPRQMPPGFQQQHLQPQQHYSNEQFMGPPPVPYPNSMETLPPGQQSGVGGPVHGQHGPPGQYPPFVQMQHSRPMVPAQPNPGQRQQAGGSNEVFDDRGTPGSYYPAPSLAPSPSSAAGGYGNVQRMPAYPGTGYPMQPSASNNAIPAGENMGRSQHSSLRETIGDGQPGSTGMFAQPSTGQIPPAQNNYVNPLTSPGGSSYQPQYSHDSGNNNSSAPPNQYIRPQGSRFHGPVSSASTEIAPASGMISHSYRSNAPSASSYGPVVYNSQQQSAAPPFMPQSQQLGHSANAQAIPGTNYPPPPSSDAYPAQSTPYAWSNQQYPQPGQPSPAPQRFGPVAGSAYSQAANLQQGSAEYGKPYRGGQAGYPRPGAYPSCPPSGAPPYTNVPPNMSLRPDLGMKSLPSGAAQYPQPVMASSSSSKKDLSPASIFPPGSVEATTFSMKRRRKLLAKDIGSVEAWRLVMALRSGLQAETIWALNSLNVLLYDDSSVLYFGLASLPGLLEALVEHWRRALTDLLGEAFSADEVQTTSNNSVSCGSNDADQDSSNADDMDAKRLDLNIATYRAYDCVNCYESGLWQRGGGASTDHLKLKMDSILDEVHLSCGIGLCDTPFSECRLKRKRKRKIEMEMDEEATPSKQPHLHSAMSSDGCDGKVESYFFFNSRPYNESDEIEMHSNLPLQIVSMAEQHLADRCLSISNIIRGLSFIPGNEVPMCKHAGLLRVLAELLLMCHKHIDRGHQSLLKNCMDDSSDETKPEYGEDSSKSDAQAKVDIEDPLWFWDHLMTIIDDAFVVLCNLSTHLDLFDRHERVSLPLLNALLHWAACRSPIANDPAAIGAHVSPQRYAIEILCKLSVQDRNVDLMLATPPWSRIEFLLDCLSSMLTFGEDMMVREFAVVLIHALCNASQVACVAAALRTKILQQLVIFLEQADANMHQVVQTHGMQVLRDNPELIGTSVGMLRRAATSLLLIAKMPSTHSKFGRFQQRLLHFTMSHLMDSRVAATVAETLYELQKAVDLQSSTKPNENASHSTKGPASIENSTAESETKTTTDQVDADNSDSQDLRKPSDEVVGNVDESKVIESVKDEKLELSNDSEIMTGATVHLSNDIPVS